MASRIVNDHENEWSSWTSHSWKSSTYDGPAIKEEPISNEACRWEDEDGYIPTQKVKKEILSDEETETMSKGDVYQKLQSNKRKYSELILSASEIKDEPSDDDVETNWKETPLSPIERAMPNFPPFDLLKHSPFGMNGMPMLPFMPFMFPSPFPMLPPMSLFPPNSALSASLLKEKIRPFECDTCHEKFNHAGGNIDINHIGNTCLWCFKERLTRKSNIMPDIKPIVHVKPPMLSPPGTTHIVQPKSNIEKLSPEMDIKSTDNKEEESRCCNSVPWVPKLSVSPVISPNPTVEHSVSTVTTSHPVQYDRDHDKNYICKLCTKKFPTPYKLKLHLNSHTNNRPFKCETCGMGFMRPTNLVTHRKVHNPKQHHCPLCNQAFRFAADRIVHIVCQTCTRKKTVIREVSNGWECTLCDKFLDSEDTVTAHIRQHPRKVLCPVCDKDFTSFREHHLVKHVKLDHPGWLQEQGL